MAAYQSFDVTLLSGAIGAEIDGLDLSRPLSNQQAADLHQAFLDYKVVFLRDQEMTPDQQEAVGRLFGDLTGIPFVKSLDGYPAITEIVKEPDEQNTYNFGGAWHTDMTFLEEPAIASVLYGKEVPKAGGDTMFANTAVAYDALSDGLKRTLEGMTALHAAGNSYGTQSRYAKGEGADKSMAIARDAAAEVEVEHPVVRVHPETGQKCLYVNPNFTKRFKDMTEDESRPLLDYLYAHMTRDEFTCRFKWTPGAVAIWDNRVTMHRAVNDYDGSRRVAHRVTVGGDRPRAIAAADGRAA